MCIILCICPYVSSMSRSSGKLSVVVFFLSVVAMIITILIMSDSLVYEMLGTTVLLVEVYCISIVY